MFWRVIFANSKTKVKDSQEAWANPEYKMSTAIAVQSACPDYSAVLTPFCPCPFQAGATVPQGISYITRALGGKNSPKQHSWRNEQLLINFHYPMHSMCYSFQKNSCMRSDLTFSKLGTPQDSPKETPQSLLLNGKTEEQFFQPVVVCLRSFQVSKVCCIFPNSKESPQRRWQLLHPSAQRITRSGR